MTLMIPTTSPVEAELALPTTWVAWMIFICVLNGATALACVVIVLHKTNELNMAARAVEEPAKRIVRQNALAQDAHLQQDLPEVARITRKRKNREHIEFPFARIARENAIPEPTQDRLKRRRVATAAFSAPRFPRRSRSFGYETSAPVMSEPSPLRRVVSCGDVASSAFTEPCLKTFSIPADFKSTPVDAPCTLPRVTAPSLLREIRLHDVLSSAKAVILSKLREAARNAVDEMLTSAISFLTYGTLLLLVRQYSAIAVGVSIDLGAFSIEL